MSRSVKLLDEHDKEIGKLLTASNGDILRCIAQGFKVVDVKTGSVIQESDITDTIGVSDGIIVME
jgi:hypothetical protein